MAAIIDFLRAKQREAIRNPPRRPPRVSRTAAVKRVGIRAAANEEIMRVNDLIRDQGSSGFFGVERSIDNIMFWTLPRLRTESRYAYRHAPIMRRTVARWKNGVVGSGPRMKMKDGPDSVAADWAMFADAVDDRGEVSLGQMLRLAMTALLVDGEFAAHWVMTSKGLRLRLIDAWRIDTWRNEATKDTPDGHKVVMGIESDPRGEITAFYVMPEQKDARISIYMSSVRGDGVRIPAEEMIFVKNQEYAQQTRGIPMLVSMIGRSDMLEEYSNTELERAGLEGRKLGFLQRKDGTGPPAQGKDQFGNPVFETGDGYTIHELEEGQEFSAWDTGRPSPNYSSFVDAQIKELAAGSEAMTSADVTGDYSNINFSAGRLASLHSRESFEAMRHLLELRVLRPLFVKWLKSTRLTTSPSPDAMPTWKWSAMPHIQPREQAMADQLAVQLGSKSLSEVIRERGADPDEVFKEIEEDKERLEAMGLSYPTMGVKEVVEVEGEGDD